VLCGNTCPAFRSNAIANASKSALQNGITTAIGAILKGQFFV